MQIATIFPPAPAYTEFISFMVSMIPMTVCGVTSEPTSAQSQFETIGLEVQFVEWRGVEKAQDLLHVVMGEVHGSAIPPAQERQDVVERSRPGCRDGLRLAAGPHRFRSAL
jgi:hypothetical protein